MGIEEQKEEGERPTKEDKKSLVDNHSDSSNSGLCISFNSNIIMEILSRVPATSLVVLSLVCKLWHEMITRDRYFKELHFKRTLEKKAGALGVILLCRTAEGNPILTLLDDSFVSKDTWVMPETCFYGMTASHNGLVCIYDYDGNVLVLNPSTRERIALSKPTESEEFFKFFFGFHPSTNEYKVVAFSRLKSDYGIKGRRRLGFSFHVLTLGGGNRSWRMITYLRSSVYISAVCIDGVMYWVERGKTKCIAFDLKDETFTSILCPVFGGNRYFSHVFPLELEGCLCLGAMEFLGDSPAGSHIDLWILKDATTHSWILRYRITEFPIGLFESVAEYRPPILRLAYNGRGLFQIYARLCYFDLQSSNASFKEVYCGSSKHMMAEPHVGTLVSLQDL